jgi:shikimate dehydrogenase
MPVSPVLNLHDLEDWSRAGTSLAVLGHPIKHSISPAMHNAALAELALVDPRFAAWEYFRFEIHPADLPRALVLLYAKKFRGVNLTVPHKIIAFDHVAEVDVGAHPVGAVNTLRWEDRGWKGFNTDGYGLAAAIRENFGRDLSGGDIILIGAGGAARGAAVECIQRGCASLHIANRTREKLDALLHALAPLARGITLSGFSPNSLPATLPKGAILINATSAGLIETDPLPVDLRALPRPSAVFDMIYNPSQTRLLRAAAQLGVPGANGLSMLVHQGAKALEIWSGISAPRTAATMAQAALRAMSGG